MPDHDESWVSDFNAEQRGERDLVRHEGTHKLIDVRDANGVPRSLWHTCACGGRVGYGIDHDCDFTPHEPDEAACPWCDRYRNCRCDEPLPYAAAVLEQVDGWPRPGEER